MMRDIPIIKTRREKMHDATQPLLETAALIMQTAQSPVLVQFALTLGQAVEYMRDEITRLDNEAGSKVLRK